MMNSRIGLHYFPDMMHYRVDDLKKWLPIFTQKQVNWVILNADVKRAIPEFFINALAKANIQPILDFNLPIDQLPQTKEFSTLLKVYARWGVRYVMLFDRPNQKASWNAASWSQQDLVDRFLDQYIPVARQVINDGLIPVFPALEPGGNYWDTAFLRAALKGLQRRKQTLILQNLVLSAYAHTNSHELNWGIGGPERWPQTRPYLTPDDSQDQQGFRIFDWYQSIAESILQKKVPVILLQSGFPGFPVNYKDNKPLNNTVWANQAYILQNLQEEDENSENSIPQEVMCCNFWLLAADESSEFYPHGWYQGEHCLLPELPTRSKQRVEEAKPEVENEEKPIFKDNAHPIKHYLLLPTYEWGIADWHLEVIQPYVKKYKATIGFSLDEAKLASKVTIIGSPQSVPEETIQEIREAGCYVERITGDGTSIATQLAER